MRKETQYIAENLRTHKKLKFKNWPGSVLINSEMLQFPALLEHARRGDTKSWYTPFLQGHPNSETDHQTVWVIPMLIHTLLHQVIPNAETDRHTIWENADTLVAFFFCWIMKFTNAQAWGPWNSKQRTLGPGRRDSRSDSIITMTTTSTDTNANY